MMQNASRRNFIKNARLSASALGMTSFSSAKLQNQSISTSQNKLPREVGVATLSTHKMKGSSFPATDNI